MVPKPTITVSQKLVEYDDASSQVMSMGLRSARRENKQCILELPNKISQQQRHSSFRPKSYEINASEVSSENDDLSPVAHHAGLVLPPVTM